VILRTDPRFADAVSPPEVDFLMLCREAGLALPQVNVLVEGRKVDFYWPKQRLVVESDSYSYHADRPAFERDHASTVALELAGYRVLRTTREMLRDAPGPFIHLVRERLAE
jgi:very-short-patch-repair endonuclease